VKLGFVQQMFVGNTLLHFYAAMRPREILGGFFDEMVVMNTVSWNSVGGGGTLASLLFACSQEGNLQLGRLVHCHMLVSGAQVDLVLGNASI
jgi:hypothetical protein